MPRLADTTKVLVVDIESTCWEEPEKPGPGEVSEIIEIGIAVVDTEKLVISQNESILVKPTRSKVSNFCNKLTTLTQEQVDQGIVFRDAIEKLRKDFRSHERTFVSWGDYDRKMFDSQCYREYLKYPFGPRHLNLKNCFTLLKGLDREPGMDAALDLLKMKLEGTHHRGVDDARNIANIFVHILKKYRGI